MKGLKSVLAVAIGLFVILSTIGMWGGSGEVVQVSSGQPVAGATVALDCKKNLFHGSETLKTLTTLTDDKGRFAFSFFDVWRCDFAKLYPSKTGYVDTGSVDIRYIPRGWGTEIPRKLYLTLLEEAGLQRLKYRAAMSSGISPSAYPKQHYIYVYPEFLAAKKIAKTDAEVRFVKESFCRSLIGTYRALSDAERSEIKGMHVGQPPEPIDHDRQVETYCAAP